jgi:hypothetical protein
MKAEIKMLMTRSAINYMKLNTSFFYVAFTVRFDNIQQLNQQMHFISYIGLMDILKK